MSFSFLVFTSLAVCFLTCNNVLPRRPRAEGDASGDVRDAKEGTFEYGVKAEAYSPLVKRASRETASVFII
jgi:hypothetical protein